MVEPLQEYSATCMNPILNGRNSCEPKNIAPPQIRGEDDPPAAKACRGASGDDEARI